MKINFNIPKVFWVEDYHEIDDYEKVFKSSNPKIKVVEIDSGYAEDGPDYSVYWGLIYSGKKPNKKIINEMLKKHGFIEIENYH